MHTESRHEGEANESAVARRHAQWLETRLAEVLGTYPETAAWQDAVKRVKEFPVLTRTTTQL